MKKLQITLFTLFLALAGVDASGQGSYKRPPKPILDVLHAPAIPTTMVSPARDKIVLLDQLRYPPISELAEPMLRIAGLRINPNTSGQHRQTYSVGMRLKNISDGRETTVQLPAGAKIVSPQFSPDGRYLAIGNIVANGTELWIVDVPSARARKVNGVMLNTAFGGYSWEDSDTLLARVISSKRGPAPPYRDLTPDEPSVQETSGQTGVIQTFQDLLRSPHDERLFEYYATSQLALIEADGRVREIGPPAIYSSANMSPDGRYILTERIQRPFSYQFPYSRFPKTVEVWDTTGKVVHTVARIPLVGSLPAQGVQTGPRSYSWVPTEPAMIMWIEALDDGDPRKKVPHRDRYMKLSAPFAGGPTEVLKTEHRAQGKSFGERDGLMWFSDFNRDTQVRRTFITDYRNPSDVKLVAELNTRDRYNDIGTPVTKTLPNGSTVIRKNGDWIYLSGTGASPEGDRPFLRRFNLKTLKIEEMFRSSAEDYETFVALVDDQKGQFITRKENVAEPPNLWLKQSCPSDAKCPEFEGRKLTDFKDTAPQLRGITKRLVRYKRADGVDVSFTLYLPPGYKQGTRLPTVVWAYPLEFTDTSVAGQVRGSTDRFTQISGTSHLFFLLDGYAVLDNTTMPIVGDPKTVNDTFVKQITDSAKAAIDKAVELGVTDPDRVGVGGHSYGAFMTANLLAHTDLFRAGIARSGAYNRTLTPFGFQSERRTFWEAPDMYAKVSPFFYANRINEPILLIHGEADNNTGTYPIQSERMFAAISGNGGTARLVMLPHESHGYVAKESTEHTLYEMLQWFDKYVKNARRRSQTAGN